jgi:hypothetical protein
MNSIIFLFLFVSSVYSDTITQTISLTGPGCSLCSGPNGNYACSSWGSYWNFGLLTFVDQVPTGDIVTGVSMDLYGVWGCDTSLATVNLTLQGNEVQAETIFGQCQCSTCDAVETFSWYDSGFCFPGYNYGGVNTIQVNVLSGLICLQEIVMTITHVPGNQNTCLPNQLTCNNVQCGNGTCVIDTYNHVTKCNCSSEFYGPECQCYVPSYDLITDHPPVLNVAASGFKTRDTLTLVFNNSVKYFDTTVSFKNAYNNTCNFPQASDAVTWSEVFDPNNCVNVFTVVIPWVVAWPTCIFDRQEVGNWIVFTGEMIVENVEDLGSLTSNSGDITRTLVSRLPFEVRYPKTIEFTNTGSNVTVYSDVNVVAAIVAQNSETSSPPNPDVAYVTLLTIVQYPFVLTAPYSISGDTSKFALSVVQLNSCADNGSPCEQSWMITILPTVDQCNFNGNYVFDFTVACVTSACPLDSNTNTGTISFTLQSEDFCAQIVENIDLTGTFMSFEDDLHTTPKVDFLFHQTIYFQAVVSSTKATIISTVVNNFNVVLWNNNMVPLYNYGNTVSGNDVSLQVLNNLNGGLECDLSLVVDPSVFPVPVNQNDMVTFDLVLDVTYLNTQSKKRTSKKQKFNARTILSVNGPQATQIASDSNKNVVGFFQITAVCMAIILLC